MAKNKSKVGNVSLFLQRWEGLNKAKDKVVVGRQRRARCRDSDLCPKNGDLTDEKQEFAVCGAGTFAEFRGFWLKVAHC